jgi:hypothetical protein
MDRWLSSLAMFTLACAGPPTSDAEPFADAGSESESTDTTDEPDEPDELDATDESETGESETGEPEIATLVHAFDPIALAGFEEQMPCISWTLANEQALYVQAVTLVNNGGFHHSNGFVVPEDLYEGPDGIWNCDERGFSTIEAATEGTVLFAQSTQSLVEEQRFNPGAVVKIPPHHRVVAELHMLNLGPLELAAQLRASLELVHPRDVDVVLTPFAIQYTDLDIPAQSEVRFAAECDDFMAKASANGSPFTLHWLLPHYHYLGSHFRFEVIGGPDDGEVLHTIDGFGAAAIGKRFDPPIDLREAEGLRLVCGYDNWTDGDVGWGNGAGEMCIAFGFAEANLVAQAVAYAGVAAGVEDGVPVFESPCATLVAAKPPGQGPPSAEEIDAPLYVPPIDPGDQDLPPIPACEDAPLDALPLAEPTLSNIHAGVLVPSCSFSACHGGGGAAGGLSFDAPDLHGALLDHVVQADTDLPLIDPGNPEGSWLIRKLAACEPTDVEGNVVSHMPLNAPFLIDPRLVAMVRAWISAGAPND